MPYVVTNRRWSKGRFNGKEAIDHALSYVDLPEHGTEVCADHKMPARSFRRRLIDQLGELGKNHERPLIVVPVHGYSNGWEESVSFVHAIDNVITSKVDGVTVGFTWPSSGQLVDYVGDRLRARSSAIAFSTALSQAYRLIQDARCPAEIVLVAHSMGNYMIAKAIEYVSEAYGDPSFHFFADALMVAADLDGNCFEPDGVARHLARFSRRVTAYRSVHDGALLASRAKRANTTGRRLGRQGVNDLSLIPDNVAVLDASDQTADVGAIRAHSDHFSSPLVAADMVAVVQGIDRTAIPNRLRRTNGEFYIRSEGE